LCGSELISQDQSEAPLIYPVFSKPKRGKLKLNFIAKIFLFVSIVSTTVCILVNALLWNGLPWSLIVFGGIITAWLLIGLPLMGQMNLNFMLIDQMIGVQLYVYLIDVVFGNKGWALNYVYPLLYIAVATTLVLFVIIYRMAWRDYLITLVVMSLIGFYPVLLIAFGIVDVLWPSYTAILFACLTICGLFIFGWDKLKKEIRKRLHT
jgi:hypothetical protein